jgi:hypothetical protein
VRRCGVDAATVPSLPRSAQATGHWTGPSVDADRLDQGLGLGDPLASIFHFRHRKGSPELVKDPPGGRPSRGTVGKPWGSVRDAPAEVNQGNSVGRTPRGTERP